MDVRVASVRSTDRWRNGQGAGLTRLLISILSLLCFFSISFWLSSR